MRRRTLALVAPALLLTACSTPAPEDGATQPTPAASETATPTGPPDDTGVWMLAVVETGKGEVSVPDADHRKVTFEQKVAGPDEWIHAPSASSDCVTTSAPGPTVRCELWEDGELISDDELEVDAEVPDGERYARCSP